MQHNRNDSSLSIHDILGTFEPILSQDNLIFLDTVTTAWKFDTITSLLGIICLNSDREDHTCF